VKFVTWNVNSLRARMPRVLELLDTHQPDVVALQETKTAPDQVPHLEFAMAGYRVIDHSAGRWAGVALVVRDDLDVDEGSVRTGLPDAPLPGEARWVEARVAGTTFASVYVVNGRSPDHELFEVKLAWLDAMAARMAELAGDGSAVVGGDLNVTLADVDVWDPGRFVGSTHVTPQERSRLRGLLDAGWVDAVRHLHPDGQAFTWWDYRGGDFHRNRGLRIDYVLTTADVAAGLLSAGIDRALRKGTKPSDHAPLVATWSD
jgi:exodeoxyribonuclease-3